MPEKSQLLMQRLRRRLCAWEFASDVDLAAWQRRKRLSGSQAVIGKFPNFVVKLTEEQHATHVRANSSSNALTSRPTTNLTVLDHHD